jgi:hypothetical protein
MSFDETISENQLELMMQKLQNRNLMQILGDFGTMKIGQKVNE